LFFQSFQSIFYGFPKLPSFHSFLVQKINFILFCKGLYIFITPKVILKIFFGVFHKIKFVLALLIFAFCELSLVIIFERVLVCLEGFLLLLEIILLLFNAFINSREILSIITGLIPISFFNVHTLLRKLIFFHLLFIPILSFHLGYKILVQVIKIYHHLHFCLLVFLCSSGSGYFSVGVFFV